MKPSQRQKLCQNCEGEVDLDVIVCPYCAADLREERPERAMSQSLYPPPYSMREESPRPEESAAPQQKEKNLFLPMLLFILGAQLLLLALLMLLFSKDGLMILRWEARHWFFYALASAPLLYFGYKSL